jgi:hypothetical protein
MPQADPVPVRVGGVAAPVSEGRLAAVDPSAGRVCNAVSLAYAIAIAVFDPNQVTGNLTIRQPPEPRLTRPSLAIPKPRKQAR